MLRRTLSVFNLPIPVLRRADRYPHFDVCVIGSGPGGLSAAMRAVSFGKKVCMVERSERTGGNDVWLGTLPSKTLWEISKLASTVSNKGMLSRFTDPAQLQLPTADMIDGERILKALYNASATKEEHLIDAVEAAGIQRIQGTASFANSREVDIHSDNAEYRTLSADYFIIATGSKPRDHPLYPCDHKYITNSDDMFRLPVPKSMVIIGAGAMGCEFASMLANLGKTKVYVIDKAKHILPREDADISMAVQDSLAARGVTIHHDCHLFNLETFEDPDTGVGCCQYSIQSAKDGAVESFIVDRALVTIGRRPNYSGLGLENTRMHLRDGYIDTDAYRRCLPYDHIYCVGDATRDAPTVPMAQAAARIALQDMYGATPRQSLDVAPINNLSKSWFFEDEVASIGLSEKECRREHIGYIVVKFNYDNTTRGIIAGSTNGFVKLLVSNDRQKKVLGVRAMGAHAGSVVEVVSLAVRRGLSVYELLHMNPSYPSVVSALVECARMAVGRGTRNPNLTSAVTMNEWMPPHFERGRAFYKEEKYQNKQE
ncbi:dihydrolipoamide dehydrogenase [Strigomonas culicis]|uniref:Dihydrolipoamide dehydrogenase n=1 Tax=Strigomonas culicis TaxID=28005 RepID=S9TRV7_9TRYP|nr:dihydrolipoamide dehydrogenase [Strigomonas culicis]EPY28579.1 dihydrolipoamide dehydrogenase [Strigomonas culicis]EPY30654.1 dihydrolipoamide dehydrogenase [Strigomonas culicis]|eukprot:EPY19329.1 dihydrolipoamide dehydrogenase [Strigomonas culicis]